MSRVAWEVVSWIGVAVALLAGFRVVRLSEQHGVMIARSMPQAWLWLTITVLAILPLGYSFYKYDWTELTQGAGAGQYVLYIIGGVVFAMLLNALRLVLS